MEIQLVRGILLDNNEKWICRVENKVEKQIVYNLLLLHTWLVLEKQRLIFGK